MNYFVTYTEDPENTEIVPPMLEKFLNYLDESLEKNQENLKLRDSIYFALGHLSPLIVHYASLHAGVETILKNHAFMELLGNNDILKARVLWLYGEMPLFVKDSEHAVEAAKNVYKALLDECLPVRVLAGTTLHKLSKIKEAKAILEPGISDIIEAYLKIMQEIDQDELVNALEEIVNLFEDKVEPFAFELVQELNNRFKKIVKNDDDLMSETILTANACICTIRRIIAAASKNKQLLGKIEDEIYPSLLFCLTPKGLDYIEDSLDCSILLVYHRQFISEKMWKLYYHKLKIIVGDSSKEIDNEDGGYGFEFLSIMISFIQNCISFGGDDFLTYQNEGETPFQLLTKSLERIIQIERNQEDMYSSSVCVMKIIGTILENSFGKIDEFLPIFIKLLHSELILKPNSKIYKSSILQTFSMCFVYNTELTYKSLEDLGLTEYMLKFFFSSMGAFRKLYEIRRVLYGISCIIKNDLTKAPEILKSEISAIMNVVVVLIDSYVRAKEKEINEELDDAVKMGEFENQGIEDAEEFKEIVRKLKDIKQKEGKLMDFGVEDTYEEEDETEFGDELIYTAGDLELYDSPLEKVDAPIYLKNVMGELQSSNLEMYNMLMSCLSEEQTQQLAKNLEKNEELSKLKAK